MKTRKHQKSENGAALIVAMIVLLALGGAIAVTYSVTSNNMVATARSRAVDTLDTAAEGVLDYAFGVWQAQMRLATSFLTTNQAQALFTSLPTLPAGLSYVGSPGVTISCVDSVGTPTSEATAIKSLSAAPPGWVATRYSYVASVTIQKAIPGGSPARVTMKRVFHHERIWPFSGLFFVEGDFELYKPAPGMVVEGPVHTNAAGYVTTHYTAAGDKLFFGDSSNISYVTSYEHEPAPYATNWSPENGDGPPTYERGFENQVGLTNELESIGNGTALEFDLSDSNHNNDGNHELIEPPVSGQTDPPHIAASRIYNNAGLEIEINGGMLNPSAGMVSAGNGVYTGTNITMRTKNGTTMTQTQANTILSALNNIKAGYYDSKGKWVPPVVQTVYDKREGTNVQVTDLNIGSSRSTFDAISGFNNILYIHDTTSNSNKKAIRLTNGGILPSEGLTVASQNGIYIKGDFNVNTTTPNSVPSNNGGNPNNTDKSYYGSTPPPSAAIAADTVMFLSNSWNDANASKALSNRNASHTTANTAIISGHVPSGYGNNANWYSGGMNNFPRFLETWSGDHMTYFGAFVQLFNSETFVGKWNTGDIYSPPARKWNFDTLLLSRVIPGIPPASAYSKGRVTKS
jgi:hypothetical protein